MSVFATRNRIIEVVRRGQRGLDGSVGLVTTASKSSTFTAVAGERGYAFRVTAAVTVNFEPCTTLTNGWHCIIDNVSAGNVTLNPYQSETINGLSTLAVPSGASALVYTNGVNMFARFFYGSAYTALNGFPTAADKYIYSDGPQSWVEGNINANGRDILANATAQGAALIDDADAATQRATLGLTEAIVTTALASQAEAEAGTNNTNLMTPLRVEQQVDNKVKVYRDTTGIQVAAPGTHTWSPGLGQVPDWLTLYLEVTTAYNGWAVGDRLIWTDTGNTSAGNLGSGFWYDTSADQVVWKNAFAQWAYWANPNTQSYLDATKFKAYLHCGIFA